VLLAALRSTGNLAVVGVATGATVQLDIMQVRDPPLRLFLSLSHPN
jgi:hypothetical protein